MSTQERLDTLENLMLNVRGVVKILNYQWARGYSEELQHIENLLGEGLVEVLELKKELGCTSTLSVVEPAQE